VAGVAGLLAGLSPLLQGLYDRTSWTLLGIAAMGLLMAALVVVRRPPGRVALVTVGALAALALWQFLSQSWAESSNQALVEAQRTAVYAGALGLLVAVCGRTREQLVLMAALAVGTGLGAVVEWARLVSGPVPSDFVGGRLIDPLGYFNGQAAALLLGFWPCVAIAERARRPVLGAAALGLATLLVSLAFLTQSRAALGALLLSTVVVMVLVPGRGRRIAAVLLPWLGTAVAIPRMLDVYASGNRRAALPEADALHEAMALVMIAALAVAVAWFALDRLAGRLPRLELHSVRRPALVIGAILIVAGLALGAAPAAREIDRQWTAFKGLEQPTGASRLTTAGGNRYDYWRVALGQFESSPFRGIGAGNFDTTYFRERRTVEDIRQPHSLVLQTLGETGLVGFLLLAAAFSGLALALRRAVPLAARHADARALVVAATGTLVLYLVHTNVDWLHLLPGVTLGALAAMAVLLRMADRPRTAAARSPLPLRALAFSAALLAVASLATGYRADRDRQRAEALLATDPSAAVRLASASLRLENDSLPTHFVLAAAYARQDRYEKAIKVLLRARRLEWTDFLPPTLIGDLATRRGDRSLALAAYRAALRLNPRNSSLEQSVDQARNSSTP